MSAKLRYEHLTEADIANNIYVKCLPNVKRLYKADTAYIQYIGSKKAAIYLHYPDSMDLDALWAAPDVDNNIVTLLPYQERTRGKSDPLYYFWSDHWHCEHLINWLKSLGLTVYLAASVGTSFYKQ